MTAVNGAHQGALPLPGDPESVVELVQSAVLVTEGSTDREESSSTRRRWRAELVVLWVFPNESPVRTKLGAGAVVLGRDGPAGGRIEGRRVSRRHADVRRDGPIHILRDLGSKNGVHLNGRRIVEHPLAPGDVIRLGDVVGIVVEEPSAAAAPWQPREIAPGLFGGRRLAAVLEPVARAATTRLPIVIEGETGTGKECVARAIHRWSGRSGASVAINCAALPEALAEAELFGYRRGAFTGALSSSDGHFRAADGGTLLLDEVLELPRPLQAKLLRALECGAVVPLGESTPQPTDVRIVCASQEPIAKAVEDGRFRGDLYARIAGLTASLPPLRERHGDVPYLLQCLLRAHADGRPVPELSAELIETLCVYHWPFNVRELDLLAQQLLALHGEACALRREHLPDQVRSLRQRRETALEREQLSERLLDALRAHGGNVARAAASLGVTRQRAYRLLDGRREVLDELRRDPRSPRVTAAEDRK